MSLPNWNCSLSTSRIDPGAHLCLAISLIQATPGSKSGNTIEPYFLIGGNGRILIVTSVTIPYMPTSEDKISYLYNET